MDDDAVRFLLPEELEHVVEHSAPPLGRGFAFFETACNLEPVAFRESDDRVVLFLWRDTPLLLLGRGYTGIAKEFLHGVRTGLLSFVERSASIAPPSFVPVKCLAPTPD